MGRFHEALDQLVAASLRAFTSRLEKSRRLFLGILGHDLRQPLYSIKMYSEVLLKSDSPADLRPLYASIGRCSDAMAKLLADLLEFTSARLGSPMPIYPTPCHMGTIANEVIEEFRATFPAGDFILETEGDLKGIWDTTRLRQLVSNLLSNARQHGAPDGPITTIVRESGGEISLSVHNWGKPIPKDAIGTLFDPMVRIADDDKPRPHGSIGLGLYICRQIVRAHHGDITVRSSHADGTTFIAKLPRFGSDAG